MGRYYLLLFIVLIMFYRAICSSSKKKQVELMLSLLVQIMPLGCMHHVLQSGPKLEGMSGCFDSFYVIDAMWIPLLMIPLFGFIRISSGISIIKPIIILFCLALITYFNPNNHLPSSGFPVLFRLLQILLILKIISSYIDKSMIVNGVYDGMKYAILLQATIVTLFPVLNVQIVNTLFRSEDIAIWAFRRGTLSAIGTFMHPGALALYGTVSFSFFISCWLKFYKRMESLVLMLLSLYVIFFTYSRTSYVTVLGVATIVYLLYNWKKGKISKSVFGLVGIGVIVSFFVVASGILDVFSHSDIDEQTLARNIHYGIALECFAEHPLLGIGLNTHVYYISMFLKSEFASMPSFFFENPFHNIHLIVLAEMGLVIFIFWAGGLLLFLWKSYKHFDNENTYSSIISISSFCVVLSFILYGMTGWAAFHRELYVHLILFVFLAILSNSKPKYHTWFSKNRE